MGNGSPTGSSNTVSLSTSAFIPRMPTYTPKPPKPSIFLRPRSKSFDRFTITQPLDSMDANGIPKYKIVDFKVHIGVDISSDGSALAFAYTNQVDLYTQWKAKTRQNIQKSKTYILSDDKDNIIAVGENAKQMYSNLAGSEKNEWKFFHQFKLSLLQQSDMKQESDSHSTDISAELTAINGSKCGAQTLFARILSDIKQNAMEYLHKNTAQDKEDQDDTAIQWIITVPAAWNESARQQMRQWAIDAKLVHPHIRNQCRIVSESDCAALAIHEIYHISQMEKDAKEDDEYNDIDHHNHIDVTKLSIAIDPFNITLTEDANQCMLPNTPVTQSCTEKYILIHTEGVMVDIACRDVSTGECVKEVCYRFVSVNDMFKALLINIFGEEWMNAFVNEYPNIYLEIMDNFESAKCEFWDNDLCKSHDVALPYEFVSFLHAKCKDADQTMKDKLHQFTDFTVESLFFVTNGMINVSQCTLNPISVHDEVLTMDVNIWKYMFDYGINTIITNVEQMLDTGSLEHECKRMYLVGYLACSKYAQYRMRAKFESKEILKVIVPDHPTWSVVLGAAYFGIRKNAITARKCNASYGIRVYQSKGYSLFHHSTTGYDSDAKIQNYFHVMVHKNDWIYVNDTTQFVARSTEKISTLEILQSEHKLPQFQTQGQKLGSFQLEYDSNGEVIVEFHFGDTTFIVYTYSKDNATEKRMLQEIDY